MVHHVNSPNWFNVNDECTICFVLCQNYHNQTGHLNGSKHRSAWHKRFTDAAESGQNWFVNNRCTLCGSYSDNWYNTMMHLRGMKHQTALQSHQSARQNASAAAADRTIAAPAKPTVLSTGFAMAMPSQPTQSNHVNEPNDKTSIDMSNPYTGNRCDLCSVRITIGRHRFVSAAERQSHERGAKHRMRIQLHNMKWEGEETIRQLADQAASRGGIAVTLLCDNIPLIGTECVLQAGKSYTLSIRIETGDRPTILLGAFCGPALPFKSSSFPKISRQELRTMSRSSIPVNIKPSSAEAGKHPAIIAVLFGGQLAILKPIDFIVHLPNAREYMEMLKPVSQYEQRTVVPTKSAHFSVVYEGEPPPIMNSMKDKYVVPLFSYNIPGSLVDQLFHSVKSVRAQLSTPMTAANHRLRFQQLLWAEEHQLNIDIQKHDMESSFALSTDKRLFSLLVPGLAEARPSVLVGDHVLVSEFPFDTSAKRPAFKASVHRVDLTHVYLRFHDQFKLSYVAGKKYHIRFEFGRIPLRRCHQGLEKLNKDLLAVKRFFPAVASTQQSISQVPSVGSYPWLTKWDITETTDPHECNQWLTEHVIRPHITEVGVDTESRMKVNAAKQQVLELIQIATPTHCLLFWLLDKKGQALPSVLETVLTDAGIVKYVVDSSDDAQLDDQFNVYLISGCDIQKQYMKLLNITKPKPSLEKIVNVFLPDITYVKDREMQTSDLDWPLSARERDYAASDAVLALLAGKVIKSNAMNSAEAARIHKNWTTRVAQPLSMGPSTGPLPDLEPYNKLMNDQQMNAVGAMFSGYHHPAPFLLYGPPGTGKTSTLIEAMQQLLRPKNGAEMDVKILACAPSNSAADLLAERMARFCDSTQMYRMNAVSRAGNSIPVTLQRFSSFDEDGTTLTMYGLEKLHKFQLVVATCITAATLYSLGIPSGHFTHIFIDEAGHATEPEALAAMTGLFSSTKPTHVILAGDPQQLGPIIHSKIAGAQEKRGKQSTADHSFKHSLAISLLERLYQDGRSNVNSPYHSNNNASGRYMTKLVLNYRSHPAIIEQPNKMFYDNELVVKAEKMARDSLVRFEEFPAPNFPVLFHHLCGEEQREGNSPSWFNPVEAIQVVTYVEQLLAFRAGGLSLLDIGIISPYKQQVNKIRQLLKSRLKHLHGDLAQLKVGSVEEFQGQERKAIIISTVRSQQSTLQFDITFNLGFVDHPKRMNVAITRAKAALIIVGNGDVLRIDDRWKNMIDFCARNKSVLGVERPWMSESAVESAQDYGVSADIISLMQRVHDHRTGANQTSIDDDDDDDEVVMNEEAEFVRNE